MENLKQLKGQEKYQGISVTDDHTIKNRKLIKDWIDKAKEANASEPADSPYQWKVRGTPKKRNAFEEVSEAACGRINSCNSTNNESSDDIHSKTGRKSLVGVNNKNTKNNDKNNNKNNYNNDAKQQ